MVRSGLGLDFRAKVSIAGVLLFKVSGINDL